MSKAGSLKEIASLFVDVQPGERLKTSLMFTWLFLFICCYYVLRPVRRGLVLEGLGNDYMPFVYVGTALVTGVVVWFYSKFAHLPRKRLIGTIYGIFFVNLLAWWQVFKYESAVASGIFWVWLDVFSIMGVTVFWIYANDLFKSNRAKSLFGILAAGGGLGAVLGSTLTSTLVTTLGSTNMLLVAAGIVAATLGIFLVLEKVNESAPVVKKPALEAEQSDMSKLGTMVSVIVGNRLLLFLVLVVAFERVVPDMVQFIYNDILRHMATGRDAIAALDADLEKWRGICEFAIELFVVSAVLKRFGTTFSLTSSGGIIFLGLIGFVFFPNPFLIIAIFHSDEAIRHSWFKAAKELTYTVTSRDVLYSVKPVIEMFCYRFARGLAGLGIFVVNTIFGLGTMGVLGLGCAAALGWFYCGFQLSREYRRLEQVELAKEGGGNGGNGSSGGKADGGVKNLDATKTLVAGKA